MAFAVEIDEWILKTKRRAEATLKEATLRLVEIMQRPVTAGGNMPVDTGFLRASIRGSYNSPIQPIPGFRPKGNGPFRPNGSVQRQINAMKTNQVIYIGYTAEYANIIEYGAAGRSPRGFMRLAAMQWPRIVEQVAAENKAKSREK